MHVNLTFFWDKQLCPNKIKFVSLICLIFWHFYQQSKVHEVHRLASKLHQNHIWRHTSCLMWGNRETWWFQLLSPEETFRFSGKNPLLCTLWTPLHCIFTVYCAVHFPLLCNDPFSTAHHFSLCIVHYAHQCPFHFAFAKIHFQIHFQKHSRSM